MNHAEAVETANRYAAQASELADGLKPGTWEAAQALALVSIAHSLALIADRSRQG